ncbi:unnamed protein product, partial [Bubo scandiacus]
MSPPCLDSAGNWQPPPTPPHTPFVPGKINTSEGLGKACYARRGETAGGPPSPHSPPAPRTGLRSGSLAGRHRGRGSGGGPSRGGSGACPARRAAAGPGPDGRARGCRAGQAGADKGPRLQPGGSGGRREPRGERGGLCGRGAGVAHGEVSPSRRTVFCGRNSLERRQWSGMFTAGWKTISNSSGGMCHPNVTGNL